MPLLNHVHYYASQVLREEEKDMLRMVNQIVNHRFCRLLETELRVFRKELLLDVPILMRTC